MSRAQLDSRINNIEQREAASFQRAVAQREDILQREVNAHVLHRQAEAQEAVDRNEVAIQQERLRLQDYLRNTVSESEASTATLQGQL